MESAIMIPLRHFLLEAYGGFADRRYKDPSQDHPIKIDEESTTDVSNQFCRIFVRVPDRNGRSFIVTMHHAPINADARELIVEQGGEIVSTQYGLTVTLRLQITKLTFLRKLSQTIRNTVGRGKTYADPNWKWICGRTADSLDHFADVLKDYTSERRSMGDCVRPSLGQSENGESR
jgi:hypothetical protein